MNEKEKNQVIKGEYNLRINSWKGEKRGKKEKEEEEHISYKIIIVLQGGRIGGPGKFKKKRRWSSFPS